MRNMLLDQRFEVSLKKKRSIPQIEDVFTRLIIKKAKEEGEGSPSDVFINALQPSLVLEMLIVPIPEGQELDNWEAKDIPMFFFE